MQQQVFLTDPEKTRTESPENSPHVRHALIIAAGSGMRFGKATQFRPKPLLEVAGIPIIMRTILTAHKAGIDHFTVITGYRAEVLEDFLQREVPPGITVQCIRNAKWQHPNGVSVLQAKGHIPEPFVLLMSDHLFEADILRRLLAVPLPSGYCRLAVDHHPERVLDLEDATKVEVAEGRVVNIGKELENYTAIDTGIFLCSHGLFEALEAAIAQGKESLSDGIRELAAMRRMETLDIHDLFWQDVDTENDLRAGEKKLFNSLISKKDSWLTRKINRRVSLAVTASLARTPIKPNHITLFNFGLGILAAACMIPGTYSASLAGVVLFQLASILDGCDGEIARLKFQQSHFGAWLDTTTDNIHYLALFACLTLGQVNASGSALYFVPGATLVLASFCSFVLAIIGHQRLKQWQGPIFSESRLQDVLQTNSQAQLAARIDAMANRDFSYLLIVLALIDRLHWFLWMAGIGAPIFAFLLYRVLTRDTERLG